MNGEGVFKRETLPNIRIPGLVFLGGFNTAVRDADHRCGLNTPSPFMERGTGGEVFKTSAHPAAYL